jgi:hypothetical protein
MPMHSRRSISRGSGLRRKTTWARDNITDTVASNTFKTYDLLATAKSAGLAQQGVTIARTHLSIQVWSAVAGGDQMAFGIIRGQNTDVGTSVAGAPVPIADPYEDWVWWDIRTASEPGGSGCYSRTGLTNSWTIDVRAQRRLPELQMSYNLVMQAAVVAATVSFTVCASTLLMLP